MTNIDMFKTVESDLLDHAKLKNHDVHRVLEMLMGPKCDYADLYFQSAYTESWSLENGIIKQGAFDVDRGVGARVMSGEKTGFAYADDIVLPALEEAAQAAGSIIEHRETRAIQAWHRVTPHTLYPAINPLKSLTETDKVMLLQQVDHYIRQQEPAAIQINVSLAGVYEMMLVANTDGEFAADIRPLVRMNVSVVIEKNGQRESGSSGGGGRFDYQYFLKNDQHLQYADEALAQARINLTAKPAPAGMMPVILGPGWPGILLHEAVGHGLEGDFNRKGISIYSNRIGEKVASEHCTVIDDGTLKDRRGSLSVDDEGTPTARNVLIENGVLKGYMMDKKNARLMGTKSTGNGRRESYAHLPLPRMTNTYLLPGKQTKEEMIASVADGLYAANFSGGQVDITSGKFVFSTSEAYLIKNGKITTPVKGAMLIGNGPDVLNKISMVGQDMALDGGVGTCGKDGQSVPVGVGQPTLKIDGLTVGGTGGN